MNTEAKHPSPPPPPPGRPEKMAVLRADLAATDAKLEMLRKYGQNPRKLATLEAVRQEQQRALELLEEEEREVDELIAMYQNELEKRKGEERAGIG